jgi:hypothetical protein
VLEVVEGYWWSRRRCGEFGAMQARHVAGTVVIDLIKFLKNYERSAGPLALSAATRKLLERRVLPTEWVALDSFVELLARLDDAVIRGSEERALQMGIAGGPAMRGLQKAYGVQGDPKSSVIAMRHAWRAHYDFGRLTCEALSDAAVEFVVEQYLDMPMGHGMMTAGWAISAAHAGGAPDATVVVHERPWQGASRLRFVVHC